MEDVTANEMNSPNMFEDRNRRREEGRREEGRREDERREERRREDERREEGRREEGRREEGRREDKRREDEHRDDRHREEDRRRDGRHRHNFGPREHFPRNIFPLPQEEIRYLQNGIIQQLYSDGRNQFVTVMENTENPYGPNQNQVITLVITPETVLRDQNLGAIGFYDLRVGMTIFAAYSARMTRSIPPQAVAFSIIAIIEEPYIVSMGKVAFVDARNGTLTTGLINDIYSQVIYHVTEDTDIFDRRGFRIQLNQIRSGDLVQIEHATFQTASIPPQTTAFRIFVLS